MSILPQIHGMVVAKGVMAKHTCKELRTYLNMTYPFSITQFSGDTEQFFLTSDDANHTEALLCFPRALEQKTTGFCKGSGKH